MQKVMTSTIADYKQLQETIKQLKEELDRQKEAIVDMLDGETELMIDGYKVRYIEVVSNNIDTKKLKANCPKIAERYTYQSVSNRLTIA